MANVDISQLRKSYGHEEVIHGVDLSIEDGEFVLLVGAVRLRKIDPAAHGCRARDHHLRGDLIGEWPVINDVAPKNRDIAMVFQNYALYPHLTVADNMGFSLQLRKVRRADRTEVESGAEFLGLKPMLDRYPKAAVRRTAPARRDGTRHRAQAAGVPVRRAAVQSRCQAAQSRCASKSSRCKSVSGRPRSM
jgi:multiple sugar transport system ATP-binding protein